MSLWEILWIDEPPAGEPPTLVPPTISVTLGTVTVTAGATATNGIIWGDADASASNPISSIVATSGTVGSITDQTQTSGTASWSLPNAQTSDAGTVTVTITDGDGLTAQAQFTLVVNVAGVPPEITITPSSWVMNLPIASAQSLVGTWRDSDNNLNAVAVPSFDWLVNSISRAGSEATGNLYATSWQPWTYNPTSIVLTDDQLTFTAKITDDQGFVDTATVQIDIPYDDPLRETTGHPRYKYSAWNVEDDQGGTKPFQNDAANGGDTWVTNGDPWGGGRVIDNFSHIVRMTATASTAGDWTGKFRILFPHATSFCQIRVFNGVTEEDNAIFGGARVDHDDYSSDATNISMGPYTIANGETWEFRINGWETGGSTDAADLPWWEFSSMEVTESNPGVKFWEWEAGDISYADWTTYRGSLSTGAYGRPVGSNSTRITFGSSYTIGAGHNYEVPIMDFSGNLQCESLSPWQDAHCQLVPGGSSNQWSSNLYLKAGVDYLIEFDATLNADGDWDAVGYKILLDFHPGSYPAGWQGSATPPIAIQWYNDQFELKTRHSSTGLTWTSTTTDGFPFSTGNHTFKLYARWHWSDSANSYVRLLMDDVQYANRATLIGMQHSAAVDDGAVFSKFGIYTFSVAANPRPMVTLHRITMREV